jgi:hypothetical protein
MWIRHGIHLLAADSAWIEEIEEHMGVRVLGLSQGGLKIGMPLDLVRHGRSFRLQ